MASHLANPWNNAVAYAVCDALVEHVNQVESDAVIDARVSQEAFVVGFPFGLLPGAPAPIWKRGTIALDPTFDPEGLPKILIDSATRPGMSGSVVVARHITVGRSYRKKDGSDSPPVLYAKHDLVVGIYSAGTFLISRKRSSGSYGSDRR